MADKREKIIFNIVAYLLTGIFTIFCLLPFLYTLSGSFTEENALYRGLRLIPERFTLDAYKAVLKNPAEMLEAYKITICLVVFGTLLALLVTTMTAYVLSRRDFKHRVYLSFFFYFTTLFSGGLVPSYLLVSNLGLKNTFFILMLPGLINVFNIIITRSFFTSMIPEALPESAKIDGAGDFMIYIKIYLPVSKPILATVSLIIALAYWNEWYNAMLYISDKKLYPLQYYLYNVFNSMNWRQQLAEMGISAGEMPKEGYKLAMTIFTIGPVVLFYPFAQKYFIQGITIGSVKG